VKAEQGPKRKGHNRTTIRENINGEEKQGEKPVRKRKKNQKRGN